VPIQLPAGLLLHAGYCTNCGPISRNIHQGNFRILKSRGKCARIRPLLTASLSSSWPRTPRFQCGNTGSNPVGDAKNLIHLSAMKRPFKGLPGSLSFDLTIGLVIISLIFPVSASVLCIGPSGHIEIEDINATCCASSGINNQSELHPDHELTAVGDCINCTDLLLTSNERGALLESYANVVPNQLADACLRNHIPATISSSNHRSRMINEIEAPSALTAFAPLRC
jgi:hypothetical protein